MAVASVAHQSFEARNRRAWSGYGALLVAGAALSVACRFFPADLPFWMPWEFSWAVFLVTVLALSWFALGLSRLPPAERPALWRQVSFVAGVVSSYGVLQTHFDYYAQHMFFVHRAQR